jgi:hypothetical protein
VNQEELEELKVILRPYDPEQDQPMIYATWRNSAYYSALQRPKTAPSDFFRELSAKIKRVLKHADVKIACLEHNPQVIIGYSVSSGTHLDWIYVKDDYRHMGIGTLLCPKNIQSYPKDITKIGYAILTKKNQGESIEH